MQNIKSNYFLNLIQLFLVDPSTGITTEELEHQNDKTDKFGHLDSGNDSVIAATGTEDQKLKYAILKGTFEAVELGAKTGASLSTFTDLLCYAHRMYCRGKDIDEDDHKMKCSWPKDWGGAKKYLKDIGYEDAHEYFICLSASHKHHWDIMQSATETCRFCGEVGTIN